MNSSYLSSESLVSDNTLLKRSSHTKSPSQKGDSNKWTFSSESRQVSSLAFLPILGMIIFVVCSFLKMYKWSRDSSRWKARGDVEFGDEAEVNYGIISVGDKDFCQIDIRSDGTSVYDTVTSFRLLGNGYSSHYGENCAYHDTVTSYKSLLMQRADGSQYDSVKSYKAFLQKVTQNKDIAVDVKLLDNYPSCSRSAEQCVLLKEERSERSEVVATRTMGTLTTKENLYKDVQFGRKKSRRRRASGDEPTVTRQRSLSNQRSRRVTSPACSLPSMRHPFSLSGDSEEGTHRSFRINRNKYGSKTQRIPHSVSCEKASNTDHVVPPNEQSNAIISKRRHFSSISMRHLKTTAVTINKSNSCTTNTASLRESLKLVRKPKITKGNVPVDSKMAESSSDNPNSSHSSDMDVLSDPLASGSDNDIKKNIPLSIISDGKTLDNAFFVNVDSACHLPFSSDILLNPPPKRALSETRILLARAREHFFQNKLNNAFSLMSPDLVDTCSSATFLNSKVLSRSKIVPIDFVQISAHESHSTSAEKKWNLNLSTQSSLELPEKSISGTSKGVNSTSNLQESNNVKTLDTLEVVDCEDKRSQDVRSPHKVHNFSIRLVSDSIPSLQPNT